MAILSDNDMLDLMKKGEMKVTPFMMEHLQPSSIDLTLGSRIYIPLAGGIIDPTKNNDEFFQFKDIACEYILGPKKMILAQIGEVLTMPKDCNGHIYNRSSCARIGLNVSLCNYINPGYQGQLPIVIYNYGESSIKLITGMRICQLEICHIAQMPSCDYSTKPDAKYNKEKSSFTSSIHEDREMNEYREIMRRSEKIDSFLQKRIKEKSVSFFKNLSAKDRKSLEL